MRVIIREETYITLDTIAECYEFEVEWIEEVYGMGLLGTGENVEGRTAIPSRMLERVAELRRLCHYHGLDPYLVDVLFGNR
jgi:hypothetical protein